ncbi:unnamed protein product [Mytilus coruscus]|uniref:Uncharacterized protein n=1 Tax=Mytilus coruscus TaxID=42192 RepID=A0A6J8D4N1_MYTCO|nr:unnamed protein product [Mytilus coruscus]
MFSAADVYLKRLKQRPPPPGFAQLYSTKDLNNSAFKNNDGATNSNGKILKKDEQILLQAVKMSENCPPASRPMSEAAKGFWELLHQNFSETRNQQTKDTCNNNINTDKETLNYNSSNNSINNGNMCKHTHAETDNLSINSKASQTYVSSISMDMEQYGNVKLILHTYNDFVGGERCVVNVLEDTEQNKNLESNLICLDNTHDIRLIFRNKPHNILSTLELASCRLDNLFMNDLEDKLSKMAYE